MKTQTVNRLGFRWAPARRELFYRVFERLTSLKSRRLACSDFDGLASLRVAASTGGAVANSEAIKLLRLSA